MARYGINSLVLVKLRKCFSMVAQSEIPIFYIIPYKLFGRVLKE